jgi:hypothetical protein
MTKLEEKMWNDDINFITMLRKENKELQDKIDKAIEYINTWVYDEYSISIQDGENSCYYDDEAINNLLDILKS